VGLLTKLGSAPIHQWLPSVMAGMSWVCGYVMMTWQKLGPLWLLSTVVSLEGVNYLLGVAVLNALVGAWGGLNQTGLRPLMGYSSVRHLGWMLAVVPFHEAGGLIYWAVYRFLLLAPVLLLFEEGIYSVKAYPGVFGQGNL